jgi:hypothetical protein
MLLEQSSKFFSGVDTYANGRGCSAAGSPFELSQNEKMHQTQRSASKTPVAPVIDLVGVSVCWKQRNARLASSEIKLYIYRQQSAMVFFINERLITPISTVHKADYRLLRAAQSLGRSAFSFVVNNAAQKSGPTQISRGGRY